MRKIFPKLIEDPVEVIKYAFELEFVWSKASNKVQQSFGWWPNPKSRVDWLPGKQRKNQTSIRWAESSSSVHKYKLNTRSSRYHWEIGKTERNRWDLHGSSIISYSFHLINLCRWTPLLMSNWLEHNSVPFSFLMLVDYDVRNLLPIGPLLLG